MKLTAAFVAAALAASRVHGLPIADSNINLVAARSDVKLDGGEMLQAAKRGTDTDLLTRQLHHAGDAQQVLITRDTGEHQDGTVAQRDILSTRAPVIIEELSHADGVVPDLSNAASSHSVDLPDIGALRVSDSDTEYSTSASELSDSDTESSTSEQLVSSPHKSTGGDVTDQPGAETAADEAKRKSEVEMYAWHALGDEWGRDTNKPLAKEALSQHWHLFHKYANERVRAVGWDLGTGDMKDEVAAKTFLKSIKTKPTSTRQKLRRSKARENLTLRTLPKYKEKYDPEMLDAAMKQAKSRKKFIDKRLKRTKRRNRSS